MDSNYENNLLTNSDFESLMDVLKTEDLPYGSPIQIEQNLPYNDEVLRPQEQQDNLPQPPPLEQYEPTRVESRRRSVQTVLSPESSPSLSPTGTIPSRDIYPGVLEFEIFLDPSTVNKKSWLFSTKLNKVFIDMNKALLVQFQVNNFMNGLYVRGLPVFQQDDFVSVPVQRCAIHSLGYDPHLKAHPEEEPGVCYCVKNFMVRHVLLSTNPQAQYDYDPKSDRHSVVVPLGSPQPGSDTATIEYQFACKTSCPHGMNRKPIIVIFTLENENREVLGRQILPVKICSCPKRDKEKEEGDVAQFGNNLADSKKRRMSASERQGAKRAKNENHTNQEEDANLQEWQDTILNKFKDLQEAIFKDLDCKFKDLDKKLHQIALKQSEIEEKLNRAHRDNQL